MGIGVGIVRGVDIGLGVTLGSKACRAGADVSPHADKDRIQINVMHMTIALLILLSPYASAASSPVSDFFLNFSDFTSVSA